MRPRKIILCFDQNESELSILKYLLEIHGYRALTATIPQEAIALFAATPTLSMVLVADYEAQLIHGVTGKQLVATLKAMAPHVPMMLLGDLSGDGVQFHVADALISKRRTSSFELLERIRLMSARKRGPRKKEFVQPVAAVTA